VVKNPSFPRNAPLFFDWPPFGREKTTWIPAFAGMTGFHAACFSMTLCFSMPRDRDTAYYGLSCHGLRWLI
jgi:hypothetical protein